MDAALAGDEALAAELGHAVVPGWATFAEALPASRRALLAAPGGEQWGCLLYTSDAADE